MTPREAAREIIIGLPLDSEGLQLNAQLDFIEMSIKGAITADRAQLQAEILKTMDARFSHPESQDLSKEHCWGIARNIVQSVFSQSSPAEEKPNKWNSVIHLTRGEFKTYCHNQGPTLMQGKLDGVTCRECLRVFQKERQAESDRRVLAEREALLVEIGELPIHPPHGYSAENAVWYARREICNMIRARLNPQPTLTIDSVSRKLGEQAEEIRTLKKERDDLTQHLFIIGERLEKLEKIFDPDGHSCRNCPACEDSDD